MSKTVAPHAHRWQFYSNHEPVSSAMASTSYEKERSKVYSLDLRWRMVWQHEVLGLSVKRIAENQSVDSSTVRRTLASSEPPEMSRTSHILQRGPFKSLQSLCSSL